MGTTIPPLPNQGSELPDKSRRVSKIAASILLGFALALAAMGLPMIGISVNIYLGALLLLGAFALFAYAFWVWETAGQWSRKKRLYTLAVLGLIYFVLIGYQIHLQYKKDHVTVVATNGQHSSGGGSGNGSAPIATGESGINTPKSPAPTLMPRRKPRSSQPLVTPPQSPSIHAPEQQHCQPGSICNQNSPNLGDQTVNNYRPSLPEIDVSPSSPVKAAQGDVHSLDYVRNPGAEVYISVRSAFQHPAFIADCSVPCRLVGLWVMDDSGNERLDSEDFQGFGTQDRMTVGVSYTKPLFPRMRIRLLFESWNGQELTVSNVRPYAFN